MSPDRRDDIALRVVSVAVVGSLAVALAGLTWRLTGWDDGRSEVAVAETLPPLGVQAAGSDGDVARIVALAPFGGGAATVGGVAASTQGLVLKGVLMAFPPGASTALIAGADGPATIYGIGQSPAANAIIESIGVDHVILLVGGARERLGFPETPVDPAAMPGAGISVAPAVAPQGPLSPQTQAALASASAPATSAVAAAGATPTQQGYRIGNAPSADLRRFGLQPGDVIQSVNGQPVGDAASDQQVFERARSAGQARVVVVRGGRNQTLTVSLR